MALVSLIISYDSDYLKEKIKRCANVCLFKKNSMPTFYYIHCFFQAFNYSFVLLVWSRNSNLVFMPLVLVLQEGHSLYL